MLMKDGTAVPQLLEQALEKDIYALKVFMSMSETYQKLYVMQITQPRTGNSMRERMDETIKDIYRYGRKNGI